MLVKNAKVFYLADGKIIKPKFKRRPIVHITPISVDVDQLTIDLAERWALIGGGGCDSDKSQLLIFSEACEDGKSFFEVKIQFKVACHLYGSMDKDCWHGVVVRLLARKDYYWKDMEIAKISPRERFDKKPLKHYKTR